VLTPPRLDLAGSSRRRVHYWDAAELRERNGHRPLRTEAPVGCDGGEASAEDLVGEDRDGAVGRGRARGIAFRSLARAASDASSARRGARSRTADRATRARAGIAFGWEEEGTGREYERQVRHRISTFDPLGIDERLRRDHHGDRKPESEVPAGA
jgi:hypothetical protein